MDSNQSRTGFQGVSPLSAPIDTDDDFAHRLTVMLAVALVAAFAVTSALSPLAGEDYSLTSYMPQASLLQRLVWVFGRSALQIRGWNARFGEQLAIFWLTMPHVWFVAANTLAFVSFGCVIAMFARGSVRWTSGLVSSTSVCLAATYLLWPRFETFFWTAGTSNYLHPLVLTLIVLVPFLVEDCDWLDRLRGRAVWAMMPIAFLAGASFESLPPGMLLCMAFGLWREWRRGGPYLLRLLAVACAYALGWIVLMAAPSTAYRTQWYHEHSTFAGFTLPYLLERTVNSVRTFLGSGRELLFVVMLAVLGSWFTGRVKVLREGSLLILGFGAVAASAFVIAAPYTEPRSFSILWITLIIALDRLVSVETARFSQRGRAVFAAGLGTSGLAMAAVVLVAYAQFAARVDSRSDAVISRIGTASCQEGVALPLIRIPVERRIMADREIWVEEAPDQMSEYFHCKVVPY